MTSFVYLLFKRLIAKRSDTSNQKGSQATISLCSLILLFLVGCESETQLDRDVDMADSRTLSDPSRKIDSVVVKILDKYNSLRVTDFSPPMNDELLKVVELRDTTNLYIRFSIYQNLKSSFTAFRNHIETEACCVSDEDIVKLKNYESLPVFKNGASKIMLADNTVITMYLGDRIEDNKDLSRLVDSYFSKGHVKKLEIGTGGPATWTIK